jgi:hydroxyethylthiazole kinase-like uncharacterized protein yjeF
MNVVTAAEMRAIDARAINEFKIPGMVLMENAGIRLAERIRKMTPGKRIVIVAGGGNNGGDGFVAARHLYREKEVTVWTALLDDKYGGDALANLKIIRKLNIPVSCLREDGAFAAFKSALGEADLIVDAVFGTGLSRELDSFYRKIIESVNESPADVIAVDIPSGIAADSGRVMGAAVRAQWTITFALPKAGHFLYPGAGYRGRLEVAEIGIPQVLLESYPLSLMTAAGAAELLPPRPDDSHKGTFGSVLLVNGSRSMPGAAVLSALAALRGGCGLLYAAVPQSIATVLGSRVPEAIPVLLPETAAGAFGSEVPTVLRDLWGRCRALGVGCGLSTEKTLLPLLEAIFQECPLPVVADADALNLLAAHPDIIDGRKAPTVLTPHPGEAARLLGTTAKQVQQDRLGSAKNIAARFNAVAVLKGAHTIIATPDGRAAFNTTGNSGMATAGSGDVLTGLLTSLLAQGMEDFAAARLAVYLHGLAADLAVEKSGRRALMAGDIADYIPQAYLRCEKINIERELNLPTVIF